MIENLNLNNKMLMLQLITVPLAYLTVFCATVNVHKNIIALK